MGLPGIGEYTASAIRSIAFGEREIVIDSNIERVVCRLFKIEKPIKQSKIEIKKYFENFIKQKNHFNSFLVLQILLCELWFKKVLNSN